MQRELIDMPDSMKALPLDKRGFPVPKFVQWFDGEPDFRVVNGEHFLACIQKKLCWICGGGLGSRYFFVVGPMCGVNRISSEPPSHRGCAEFAAKNCPFLVRPMAKRNDKGMPGGAGALKHDSLLPPAGIHLDRNPGACIVWETGGYTLVEDGNGGVLINIGEPGKDTSFWREGRRATREEIEESVVTGLPALIAACSNYEEHRGLTMATGAFVIRVLDRFLPKARSLAS